MQSKIFEKEKNQANLVRQIITWNQDEWLEEYEHGFYYDSTDKSIDESDATDSSFSLSKSDYSLTDDEPDEAFGKSILGKTKKHRGILKVLCQNLIYKATFPVLLL